MNVGNDIKVYNIGPGCPAKKNYMSSNPYHIGELKRKVDEGHYHKLIPVVHPNEPGDYTYHSKRGISFFFVFFIFCL
jgi:hypothetical protein